MVILFWLDLWQILFFPTLEFEQGTSGYLVLHSTNVPQQLLVVTSDNFRYLTLVQRKWWQYCSDWTYERFSFCLHWGFELGTSSISSPAIYPCAMATSDFHLWQFQVFNSGAEGLVALFWLDLWEISFTLGFEPGTSASQVLHSTTEPHYPLVFTSDNFRYLTLVQRDWWWYCSYWTCETFSFCLLRALNWGPLDL